MFENLLGIKKKKRVTPTKSEKNKVWDRQGGKCYYCKKKVDQMVAEYHHKDGDRSNWKLSNIVLIHSNCHKKETNEQRIRKVHKRRKEKEAKERDPFGLAVFGKSTKRKKSDSLFGSSEFGFGGKSTSKKKGKKKKGYFGFDF